MTNVTSITDGPKSKQEKLDDFAEGICNGLSREAAYIAAGYSPLNCRANANKFYRANHEYVSGVIAERIGTHAPAALKVLLEVMTNPDEKGGIRIKAAEVLLDRGGFSTKQRIEISAKDVKDLSTEELQNEISKLITENPSIVALFDPKALSRE